MTTITITSNGAKATIYRKGDKGDKGDIGAAFTYDDFTPEQLALLVGEQGERGEIGLTGDAFTYADFTPEQLLALKGDKGDAFTYADFTTEQLALLIGEQGQQGAAFTYADFTPEQLALLVGEKGDKGDKGDTGLTGPAGAVATVVQTTGTSETDVMSQKAATDNFATVDCIFKTLTLGTGGLVTLSPTTSYFTYRLNVLANVVLNIDLHRMIAQVGNARCRLIIDMPVVKTVTIAKPFLWGGTVPTFAAAGQYVFDIIDVDGSGTALIWQVASTTKAQTTGVLIYVDGTTADYTVAQINGETATRTTSTWAAPFRYPQNAINAASAGDIIFIKAGTYYPTHLRTTPTSYTDGDHLLRDATFSQKAGVDVYGGFLGTETKVWQRIVDVNGLPTNKTIFSGDIKQEAAVDGAKTIGDRRTDASKANAAYNVVYANVASYTYLNGVDVKYGFANGAATPVNRGGGVYGANTNLVVSFCTITGNTAATGGGTYSGTVINCTIMGNTATSSGGGTAASMVINCTIMNNATNNGGGGVTGTLTNCIIAGNTAALGGGIRGSTVINCTIMGNTATSSGGGTYSSIVINCTITNNKGSQAVFGSTTTDTNYNNFVFGNKNAAGDAVAYDNKTASGVKIFRNNAYDTAHPTITGGAGSDIDTTTCIQNLTLAQAGIIALSFAGVPTTSEQVTELNAYISAAKARPTGVNLLKAAGINSVTYPAPTTDITGAARPLLPNSVTIGAYESE